MITRSVPRYLWPDNHQRAEGPFGDDVVREAARRAVEPYAHLPLGDALRKIREDQEKNG